ncbi:hypothetical protein Sjap_024416 [Stephania japonica]|uniref:30S ribosomal protein 3, chloroplastic n=1 Tax=Stephania japonica TaxID=461633 RepID=A0AAP0EM05_9MAGN
MLSMASQPAIHGPLTTNKFLHQTPLFNPTKPTFSAKSKVASFTGLNVNNKAHNRRKLSISASAAAAEAIQDEEEEQSVEGSAPNEEKENLHVVVKPLEKPRLVLKFIWMEKNIGLALDQVIPGHGTIPLSPYYFWPRKDAWEELRTVLESKPWISQKRMIILLNQATDIINLWQQSGGNLA